MPTNASPHFQKAEQAYLEAETTEQKIIALKKMISLAPSHKGAENLRKQLKRRLARLKYTKEKESKKGKGQKGIKKAEMQASIIGLTNSGKSSLLKSLTNAKPEITSHSYTTQQPIIGTLNYTGVKIQTLDLPAIESELFDQGIANNSDTLLIIIEKLEDLKKISPFLTNAKGKQLILFNKIDLLTEQEKRKIKERAKSKKIDPILISAKDKTNLEGLKEKLWQSFNKIRVYTKKHEDKTHDNEPVVLDKESTIEDLADKIRIPEKSIKQTTITGPSSKFPKQKVGLSHILKDKDIVEFKTV